MFFSYYLYNNFNKQILLNVFLLKLSYIISCVKFNASSKRNSSFFPQKREEAMRSESVKINIIIIKYKSQKTEKLNCTIF